MSTAAKGSAAAAAAGSVEDSDPRTQWLQERVMTAFKHVKTEKFKKSFYSDESIRAIREFLDSSECRLLVVYSDNVTVAHTFPKNLARTKAVYFLKPESVVLRAETMGATVMCGEMTRRTLAMLEQVLQNVYRPLLSNPGNQDGWGEVAAKEVVDKLHAFLASTSITLGQTEGSTCLPLPAIDLGAFSSSDSTAAAAAMAVAGSPGAAGSSAAAGAAAAKDAEVTAIKERIHLLEGAVITWTKQIKNVLRQDPESLLKQGSHPTPDKEVEFWEHKAANLNAVFDQLQSDRVRRILRFLDANRSTYCTPFAKLCKEVFAARLEANDNARFLRTLLPWFTKLNEASDFESLPTLFRPIAHTILLIWKHSKHYSAPARLVVLVRQICNAVINQACAFVSGEEIFRLIEAEDAAEAVRKLKATLWVCGAFKSVYFEYKARANDECPSKPWRIQNNALFMRLDSFLERCHDILDLTQTIVQFSKLARIDIGGTKGKTLTTSVSQIHNDFLTAVAAFKDLPYDVMDVSAKQFDDDFYEFRCRIKELERRLGSVLTQAFDDCATIQARFKLLDSFEGLLERPIIQDELEKKHLALVQAYGQDVRAVQELFMLERDGPPIGSNLPPIAGALTWCRGLRERVDQPMEKLQQLSQSLTEREEGKEVAKAYAVVMAGLQEYESQKVEEWGADVESSSQAKLKLPLLTRDDATGLLSVNFDPALVRLLREVKYFLLLELDVPESALTIYKRAEMFRQQTGNLDLIVNLYNGMMTDLLPVERPLVASHLERIDRIVKKGVEVLNWKSHGIDTFLTECMAAVKNTSKVLSTLKSNLAAMQDMLNAWAKEPLLTRKNKPVPPDEFAQHHTATIKARFQEMKKGGKDIHELLKSSNKALKVAAGLPDWRAYVDFVSNILVEGLASVVIHSLQHLAVQLDPVPVGKTERLPMLEIELTLFNNAVMFQPDLHRAARGRSIHDIVHSWVDDFFQVSGLAKRLDTGQGTYLKELQESLHVAALLSTISDSLAASDERLLRFRAQYEEYAYLWTTDLDSMFQQFLATAVVTSEGGGKLPDLAKFNEQISKYRRVQEEVGQLRTPTDIGWLRVNSQPIKQAMSTWATKWVFMFTQYLHNHVLEKLQALHDFIARVSAGLEEEVADPKDGSLHRVMAHIRDVRKTMDDTREMFAPLRDAVLLLKQHNMSLEDMDVRGTPVLDYLEAAPHRWDALVNRTFKKKEDILPLQNAEVETVRQQATTFYARVRNFRGEFRSHAPFAFPGPADEAYGLLDEYYRRLCTLRAEAAEMTQLEELFELPVSRYQEAADTAHELVLLKQLWDFRAMVEFTFSEWEGTLWADIDTDALEDHTKRLQRAIRAMGQDHAQVKGYQVYKDIEGMVKNMAVVLPLVNDLHSPAMRDRHWRSLSTVCHVKPIDSKDPKFSLADLLALRLYEHVDEVADIVETANKELKIDRKLQGIEEAWTSLSLDFAQHKDSEVFVMRASDEVIESLEAHQLELQSIVGMGRFVDFFRARVAHWQKALGQVETVLKMWLSVTKQWASLESIFLASADIRAQLPDDTKRFEGIDQEFKELMKEAVNTPNVIESCTAEGREELLRNSLIPALEQCQKSLNEYLDLKKKAYARFYFCSNTALLDILSNGNNPPRIMQYLGDCYDALCNLDFVPGTIDSTTAMWAKDRERVEFPAPFVIAGAVENWLNDLTRCMQNTLRHVLHAANEAAVYWDVEKPRHQWLFDFPAQVVLTACQIYWTEETSNALEELELGTEDAVRRYVDVCTGRLEALIKLVQGELSNADRNKIIALITMDVHNRDVVQKLVTSKAEGPNSFQWQQQLRYYWQADSRNVSIRICDFATMYSYEYVGNTGRLVITPLTDRCYITLTMALRLMLGGAPAGPAGTGKTETTKDLARALALPCYVFNCSDQMTYQTMADIFKGLAQSGAWGCFDEFNRISIEVLSVVASQVKAVLDAIVHLSVPANREEDFQHLPAGTPPVKVGEFTLMGDVISLVPTVGFFITMNPGYAGRTELPENLKALFRSCAMIRPDLEPICENMLMAEGFVNARPLAVKFVTLYRLSSELLSPQAHYDWGLRAVKAVLRVAGSLKRAEPDVEEEAVLLRALRDFNTPKMPLSDLPIFLRLIEDLFPRTHGTVPKLNAQLRDVCVTVCRERGLQPDDGFVAKVIQFQELLDVRHSVMILGPAGCGKSTVWKTLQGCWNQGKPKQVAVNRVVNPKAVTSDELYGFVTLAKEWKDGVLSIIMRGMSKNLKELGFHDYQTCKWVVLDGDIDAEWIESMNTVMDDNKVLTLVSNERVPLSDAMRLVFEINSLKNATPATVSRAGILYINESDVGWRPFMESWLARRESEVEKGALPTLFEKYVDALADMTARGMKQIVPVRLISRVMTVCHLLEGLFASVRPQDLTSAMVESYFVFACVWAFGGPLASEKGADSRRAFHEAFVTAFTAVKFPTEPKGATVFDFFFDPASGEMVPWTARVPDYTPVQIGAEAGETAFMDVVVQTADTVRLTSLLRLLASNGHGAMFVGTAGTGKTALMREWLRGLEEEMQSCTINMNYYMDARMLQAQLEQVIDKRSGAVFGPPANKRLVYFVDDLNLPYKEKYGTQNSLALLRQVMDHRIMYDRSDLGFRMEIADVQFVAAMNPSAGSFTVNERLQRHFATFAASMPSVEDLRRIYTSILAGHLASFARPVAELCGAVVAATISLHETVSQKFLPSAVKFVYNWNMRELANTFQGLCLARADLYTKPLQLQRLWLHEVTRVFGDRLISDTDMERFHDMLVDASKRHFDCDQEALHATPLAFTAFHAGGAPAYQSVKAGDDGREQLRAVVDGKLAEYNEQFSIMNLVLFEQAVEHVARIARILSNPRGNAMLVGVGGSGKQSLARLAAFICGLEVRQLSVTSRFTVNDLKESLKEFYRLAGVKATPMVFLLTDTQLVDDRFLVYVNDILSSGWISDLFAQDELDAVYGSLRSEAKAAGVQETPETMLEFFVARVRRNLHVVLCFSPVGDLFRIRARRFPGIINCTVIDWFHAWPREALVSVASSRLQALDLGGPPELRDNIAHHMAEVHMSVTEQSIKYRAAARRHNYVTPKSFLELIAFYSKLLKAKRTEVRRLIDRLDVGLSTLRKTAADVRELQTDLTLTMARVQEKKVATEALLEEMGKQRGEAEQQNRYALQERERASAASATAQSIELQAETELGQAKPAMERARAAVDCLDKASITELKSLSAPPAGVDLVTKAVLMMIEGEFKNHKWDRAKKMMAKVDAFLQKLREYKAEDMSEMLIEKMTPVVNDPVMDVENMAKRSFAAANLCGWSQNIYAYNRIFVKVKPLMEALEEARANKAAAEGELAKVEAVVAEVEARLKELEDRFVEATREKAAVEEEAANCMTRLGLAERLVNGLSSENARWALEVDALKGRETTLVGDVLLAAAFVSYVGGFDRENRVQLWKHTWVPDLEQREIPVTPNTDPVSMLASEGKVAQMMSEGLPADPVSVENGAIISQCERWPLVIDPQLQGIKWLRKREEKNGVLMLQLSQSGWLKRLLSAISSGTPVIVENLGEEIDPTLDPVLARAVFKKGSRNLYLRIGGEEVEYDPNFRLYLQTKLANPHYKPEVQAQCTLINFIATERGLEDQLLAKVMSAERPDLEQRKQALQEQETAYKIQLLELEDQLLERLANAPEDILSDVPLIEGLELTKRTASEIQAAVAEGKQKGEEINHQREVYRPVAAEGSMLYFILTQLNVINHMYQYSLDSFITVFFRAIERSPKDDDARKRVLSLRETLRFTVFQWTARGLFDRDRLILLAQITFSLIRRGALADQEVDPATFTFLLRPSKKLGDDNPLAEWLPASAWYSVQALAEFEDFNKLPSDLVEAAPRFREWFNHQQPEVEKLPLDWAQLEKEPFKKLLVLRCLRPDRMTVALTTFIRRVLPNGPAYVDCDNSLSSLGIIQETLDSSSAVTPIFFILSPGTDIAGDLDKLAVKYGLERDRSYTNISMGQGQEKNAMEKLELAHRLGQWVVLNNVHLMPRWLGQLEKKLDEFAVEGSHPDFRIFLTSDPTDNIPIGILNRSIKITNEPPSGLKQNLKRAWCSFNREKVDELEPRQKSILFALSYFHAVLIERKKFGPKGFNMMYPFSLGDLRDSAICLANYMENADSSKVPWADLRYIFGEILYGGHIVNDMDRLLANTYLDFFLSEALFDEADLVPFGAGAATFKAPPAGASFERCLGYIDGHFGDNPMAFGLHPNTELDYRVTVSNAVFLQLSELQPKDGGAVDAGASPQQVAEAVMSDILDKLGDIHFAIEEMEALIEQPTPFTNVLVLECQAMNTLLGEMRRSLHELSLGFAGELTMSDQLEALVQFLYLGRVPDTWSKLAYPSLRSLAGWLLNLQQRLQQLQEWAAAPSEPLRVTSLALLFNPQSFLTAIMQQTAQRQSLELDKLAIVTDVTKKMAAEEIDTPAKEGMYVTGMYLEGARWDAAGGHLEYAKPREMFCRLPIVLAKAVPVDKAPTDGVHLTPTYKTAQRGPTYVFTAQLRTKSPSARWVMAGVAIVMDPGE